MTAVLDARRLTVDYRLGRDWIRAVNGVDVQVRAGETVALVGESGCGKTTLGRAALGLLPPGTRVGGQVAFQGRDLYAMTRRERRALQGEALGLVFQDPMTRLDPLMTVEDHFREALKAHGKDAPKETLRRQAREALAEVGVPPDRLILYPHEFSGGMRQRIMIALALLMRPALLVADEPTTSLDVIVEAQILDLIRRLSKERNLATLLITHNLGLVAQAADRVVVMYAGDVVEDAPVEKLFERPQHPYTQGLLASTIHFGTRELRSIPGSPPDLVAPPAACRFHPRCPRARELCAKERPPRAHGAIRPARGGAAGSPSEAERSGALCWFPGPDGAVDPQAPESEWGTPLR